MTQLKILSITNIDLLNEIKNFEEEFGDQLDACHPEAFELIYEMLKNHEADIETVKEQLRIFQEDYLEELEGCNEEACDRFFSILSM